jgi:transcriptional regulator with XRE-family HTH domain
MAGWQCAAGRAILHMQQGELAALAGTTKNTIARFESGEFMPRPVTVLALEQVLRDLGVDATFDIRGEPRGVVIRWEAWSRAYPVPGVKHRKRPEEYGREMRERVVSVTSDHDPKERVVDPTLPPPPSPEHRADLAMLEAEQQRLMGELARLKGGVYVDEGDDADFDF